VTPIDLTALARHAALCVTHHHACDCREYEYAHAQEVERLREALSKASMYIENTPPVEGSFYGGMSQARRVWVQLQGEIDAALGKGKP